MSFWKKKPSRKEDVDPYKLVIQAEKFAELDKAQTFLDKERDSLGQINLPYISDGLSLWRDWESRVKVDSALKKADRLLLLYSKKINDLLLPRPAIDLQTMQASIITMREEFIRALEPIKEEIHHIEMEAQQLAEEFEKLNDVIEQERAFLSQERKFFLKVRFYFIEKNKVCPEAVDSGSKRLEEYLKMLRSTYIYSSTIDFQKAFASIISNRQMLEKDLDSFKKEIGEAISEEEKLSRNPLTP